MLEDFPLQRVEIMAPRHALDRLDRVTFGFDRKHQARADQATVDHHAAGAAVARAASLFAAGQVELVTQYIQQGELRLAQKLGGLAIDGGRYVMLAHRRTPARSWAITAARRAITPATLVRYSIVPRLSSIGLQGRRGATAPSTTLASVQAPPGSSVTLTPAPTTAISISVRGMKRR